MKEIEGELGKLKFLKPLQSPARKRFVNSGSWTLTLPLPLGLDEISVIGKYVSFSLPKEIPFTRCSL